MKIIIDMQGVQTESRHRGIGRYSLGVTRALLEIGRQSRETYLLFNGALNGIDEALGALADVGRDVRRRVVGPIRNTSSDNPSNDFRRAAAEHVFTHALGVERPDVVWLSSVIEGFTDDALVPHVPPEAFTVATLYDLIPLHDPTYLGRSRARDWYMRRLEVLKRCDLLITLSEWVRADAIERLGVDPRCIVSIGAGVDTRFTPGLKSADQNGLLAARFGISRPFVMYNGGFDKRKNVIALLEAYASLPAHLRGTHILVVVGRVEAPLADRFKQVMMASRLRSDEVVFTGFVSDDELVRLYQSCALFVFPSEQEGFGLPPLEAMACGAPTIVNNATSLPELVADPEALFEVSRPGALAARIEAALTDQDLAARLRRTGLARASHFDWHAVAARAFDAIESRAVLDRRQVRSCYAPTAPKLPVYQIDAATVAMTLPAVRRWPGHVIWSGPLPPSGPPLAADRFRLGGYTHLNDPGVGMDWLSLIEDDAVSVVRREESDGDNLWAQLANREREHPLARQLEVEDSIRASFATSLSDDDLARVADALVRATPSRRIRWLIDVTHISANDIGTGVHRVVRSVLREWLLQPPAGIRIDPVAFRAGHFHHAHAYACQLIGIEAPKDLPDDLVIVTGIEVYVGLDWTMQSLPSSAPLLRNWRRAGVAMHFLVYDLLPLTMPDAFHSQSNESFLRWMETIVGLSDVLHCISRTTARDVKQWLDENGIVSPPLICNFELGADMEGHSGEGALSLTLEAALAPRPSLLMVGTIEPRKGHAQVLDAVEILWRSGIDLALVIVGHRGWLMKELIGRLEGHAEGGKRLIWLEDASDGTIDAIYSRVTALVAASRGEGYGLPLVEAARRGKPVIARSIPVFREVAGDYPSYFDTETPEGLATHIAQWLVDRPSPGGHPTWRSWKESAESLRQAIEHPVTSQEATRPAT